MNPPAKSPQGKPPAEEVIDDREVLLAVLAYLPVMVLVPIVVRIPSEFITFHLRQGLVLFIVEFVAAMLVFLPQVGTYAALALLVPSVAAAGFGILWANRRLRCEIPLVAWLADMLSL